MHALCYYSDGREELYFRFNHLEKRERARQEAPQHAVTSMGLEVARVYRIVFELIFPPPLFIIFFTATPCLHLPTIKPRFPELQCTNIP